MTLRRNIATYVGLTLVLSFGAANVAYADPVVPDSIDAATSAATHRSAATPEAQAATTHAAEAATPESATPGSDSGTAEAAPVANPSAVFSSIQLENAAGESLDKVTATVGKKLLLSPYWRATPLATSLTTCG